MFILFIKKINIYNIVLQLIGTTPLSKLNKSIEELEGTFYTKVEAFNLGYSSKDSIVLHII